MRLEGKKVILTGGLGGIGSYLTRRLRQENAQVFIVDRQPPAVLVADLASESALKGACAAVADIRPDILINLAGMMYFGHFTAQTPENLAMLLRVNLEAPMRLAQAVVPGMIARGQGHIVNIGSVFGAIPFPHFTAYSATKAGLKGFSESLRREYGGKGLHVTHIAPRAVATPLNGGLIEELHRRTRVKNDTPEDVADFIVRAIRSRRKNVTIGQPESFFALLNALAPELIDAALAPKRDIADALLDTQRQENDTNAKAA